MGQEQPKLSQHKVGVGCDSSPRGQIQHCANWEVPFPPKMWNFSWGRLMTTLVKCAYFLGKMIVFTIYYILALF